MPGETVAAGGAAPVRPVGYPGYHFSPLSEVSLRNIEMLRAPCDLIAILPGDPDDKLR